MYQQMCGFCASRANTFPMSTLSTIVTSDGNGTTLMSSAVTAPTTGTPTIGLPESQGTSTGTLAAESSSSSSSTDPFGSSSSSTPSDHRPNQFDDADESVRPFVRGARFNLGGLKSKIRSR